MCKILFSYNKTFLQMTRKYVAVARIMKSYEDQKYTSWKEQVEASLMSYLKRNLLVKPISTSRSKVQLTMDGDKSLTNIVQHSVSQAKSSHSKFISPGCKCSGFFLRTFTSSNRLIIPLMFKSDSHWKVTYFYMVNPFAPNALFLHPLKTSENGFLMFIGGREGCIGNKWVKKWNYCLS